MYAHLRTLRLADGPDEVHKMTIARRELRRHDPDFRVMTAEAVAAVRLAVDEVKEVLTSLTPEEWDRPSACAGWRVQDLVAHMSSNWKEVVDPTPPPPDPPQLPAESLMELLVDPRRGWSADEVLAEYLAYCDPAVDALAALQAEPLASVEQRLADLGTYPLHLLADAFAFDHYCHLRIDLLAPRGPVERAVPAADAVRLAPAIGWHARRHAADAARPCRPRRPRRTAAAHAHRTGRRVVDARQRRRCAADRSRRQGWRWARRLPRSRPTGMRSSAGPRSAARGVKTAPSPATRPPRPASSTS